MVMALQCEMLILCCLYVKENDVFISIGGE